MRKALKIIAALMGIGSVVCFVLSILSLASKTSTFLGIGFPLNVQLLLASLLLLIGMFIVFYFYILVYTIPELGKDLEFYRDISKNTPASLGGGMNCP